MSRSFSPLVDVRRQHALYVQLEPQPNKACLNRITIVSTTMGVSSHRTLISGVEGYQAREKFRSSVTRRTREGGGLRVRDAVGNRKSTAGSSLGGSGQAAKAASHYGDKFARRGVGIAARYAN
ncbi:hypothetical protein Tco_0236650 [Tanacetum coccineum]